MCLLLGHADGTEAETVQPKSGIHSGGLGRPKAKNRPPPTLPPHLQPYSEKNKNTLPVINKNGVLYFNLAKVNETNLEIFRIHQPVKGITATSNECMVRSMLLGVSFVLDEDLFINCPLLKITLKGIPPPFVISVVDVGTDSAPATDYLVNRVNIKYFFSVSFIN